MKILGGPPNKNKYKKFAKGTFTANGQGSPWTFSVSSLALTPKYVSFKGYKINAGYDPDYIAGAIELGAGGGQAVSEALNGSMHTNLLDAGFSLNSVSWSITTGIYHTGNITLYWWIFGD